MTIFHGIIMLHYISIQYSTTPQYGILLFYPIPYFNMHVGGPLYLCFFVEFPHDHFSGKMKSGRSACRLTYQICKNLIDS
jgi:hypothetical protein